MILSHSELESLVGLVHRSPHQLLGMHPLSGGKGVAVRVFWPTAARIEVRPTHEKSKPSFALKKIHESGLFEGVTRGSKEVYACDLVVWDDRGNCVTTRDPYSFLPSLEESELFLFGEGNERRLYDKLGAQFRIIDGVPGVSFCVWAPNAQRVSVVGDFNAWDARRHSMRLLGASGIWEIFIPGVGEGQRYKFEVRDASGCIRLKADPFAFYCEASPGNASVVWNTAKHSWGDEAWMASRRATDHLRRPISIYEVHLGSWRKRDPHHSHGYREVAGLLVDHVRKMGFTHVEFLPVAEHAFYPSWGYQVTGFFAPTQRYGTPDDFQYLMNVLHDAGIGVLVDWVPAHFPRDDWALARFDGTALFEHEDPRQGAHQDWGTLIFNYGRHEVRNFLTSNALFWCERYHMDGLRVDAVASMLYLDYSRKEGEWVPNQYGGRENLEAVEFLRHFNHVVHTEHPGVLTVAEESTAWPQVTRPPYLGGLGFSLKWNMGWMHDTLGYLEREPIHRKYHQNDLTFATLYQNHENFVLPLSHDEVVHGKRSLIGRMPGDAWQAFANLRLLFGYQWTFPGKKVIFMGGEIGQFKEWDANSDLDWGLLESSSLNEGVRRWVADLNKLYGSTPCLYESDFEEGGFSWIDCSDHERSVLAFVRRSSASNGVVVVVLNLTPIVRSGYRVGLPNGGRWKESLNSDSGVYGGSNVGNLGSIIAEPVCFHGRQNSAELVLPPLSVLVLEPDCL